MDTCFQSSQHPWVAKIMMSHQPSKLEKFLYLSVFCLVFLCVDLINEFLEFFSSYSTNKVRDEGRDGYA